MTSEEGRRGQCRQPVDDRHPRQHGGPNERLLTAADHIYAHRHIQVNTRCNDLVKPPCQPGIFSITLTIEVIRDGQE